MPVPVATDQMMAGVLAEHPDVASHLAEVHEAAWQATDPVALELCRVRIAMLLGCDAERVARTPAAVEAGLDEATIADLARWPTSARFSARQRACLAFCEQFVIDVASLDDALATDVAAHLGDDGLIDFVGAVLVIEQRQRLRLAWERVLT